MPRQIPIVAVIILLLYPGSGIANHDTARRIDTPRINNDLAAIWNACDRLFGPAPDPHLAKNWTTDERQRANDVVDCFKQVQRKLRELSIEATDGRTEI
jgi:hypothetical protein